MPRRSVIADQSGFSIVEVLIAAFVLLVGILGVVALVDAATATTTSTKAREQGVALQREMIDAARSIPYDRLGGDSLVASLQNVPGLADAGPGAPGWTIRRRGMTYTVAVGACSVDDPTDGYGNHDAATACATGTGGSTPAQCRALLAGTGDVRGNGSGSGATIGDCGIDLNLDGLADNLTEAAVGCSIGPCGTGTAPDSAPDDYKRVVILVTWQRGSGDRFALQAETLPNPGLATAPSVVSLDANPTSSASAPITNPDLQTINFTATTTGKVASVAWYIDGTPKGNAAQTATGSPTWTFSWGLGAATSGGGAQPAPGEVLDGTYVVSAKAFDRYGQFGTARASTVVLNRRAPFAPANFAGGRNPSRGIVEFEWSPNKERDIRTYRLYRQDGTGWTLVCDGNQSACQDTSPPAGSPLRYRLVAVDTLTGAPREGDVATKEVVDTVSAPGAPANLRLAATEDDGDLRLAWNPPAAGGVEFYRIYRDGQAIADRYDRTSDTEYTERSPLSGTHDYYVTAVSSDFAESPFSNKLTVSR